MKYLPISIDIFDRSRVKKKEYNVYLICIQNVTVVTTAGIFGKGATAMVAHLTHVRQWLSIFGHNRCIINKIYKNVSYNAINLHFHFPNSVHNLGV